MFFGAGNLIFPPFLGAMAGTNTWTAMVGFAVTAIGFPILGVIAVAKAGGLTSRAGSSCICGCLYAPDLFIDRSVPGDPANGQHVV